jgi:hypothetical protein
MGHNLEFMVLKISRKIIYDKKSGNFLKKIEHADSKLDRTVTMDKYNGPVDF